MRRKITGIFCMLLGAILILSALALVIYNRQEDQLAGQSALNILPDILSHIEEKNAEEPTEPPLYAPYEPFVMTVVEIDGYGYIGYLSIPALDLELPVMADWSYPQLRIAPCRQFGTTRDGNLVIAGHNYQKHFGRLNKLTDTDVIFFTDMDGEVSCYRVGTVDVIPPDSTEEVENSPWDLILYTCTYGGRSRVMVGGQRITREELEQLVS